MTGTETKKRLRLDLRGEVCPYTFVRVKLALENEDPTDKNCLFDGDELEAVFDHQPAETSVPRALREEGHEVLRIQRLSPSEPGEPHQKDSFMITMRKRSGDSKTHSNVILRGENG